MREFFLDIETIALPPEQREFLRPNAEEIPHGNTKDPAKIHAKTAEAVAAWERGDEAALDPLQCRVALIGYARGTEPVEQLYQNDEAQLLREFWSVVAPRNYDADTKLIGHCIRFDAGMLVRRSWIHGVPVPPVLLLDLYSYAPRHWIDTGARWLLGDRKGSARKIAHLCAAFSIPVKDSQVTGATFGRWWEKDRAACLEYNSQDVEAVRSLWQRIGGDFTQPAGN